MLKIKNSGKGRKPLFVALVLFGLLFSQISVKCFADVSEQFKQAQAYIDNWDYEQAEEIYKTIVQDYPDTNDALEAQRGLALLYISLDKSEEAQGVYQQNLITFSPEESTPEVVIQMAEICFGLDKNAKALELYQYALGQSPDVNQAMLARAGVAVSNIAMRNDSEAQEAIDQLLTDFSEHNRLVEAFVNIADTYSKSDRYKEALQYYQYSVDQWPDNAEYALQAQTGVAVSNIALGNDANAQAAIDELFTDFSENEQISLPAIGIADTYRESGRYEEALQLYQHVADNWPDSKQAIWARVGVVASNIALGQTEAAQAAVDGLLADFPGDGNVPEAFYVMSEDERYLRKHINAYQLYQFSQDAAAYWPADENAIWSHTGAAIDNIILGDDPNAEVAIDTLIADFNSHPNFPQAVFRIADIYFNKNDYPRAMELWELILSDYPESPIAGESLYLFATSYRQMKDYPTAIEYYKQMVEQYPNTRYSYRGPYNLGILYRRLKDYEQSVFWFEQQRQLYSDRIFSQRALFFEGIVFLFDMGDYQSAADVFQEYIELYPGSENVPLALYDLAQCYEKMGDKTQAIVLLQRALTEYPDSTFANDITKKLIALQEG